MTEQSSSTAAAVAPSSNAQPGEPAAEVDPRDGPGFDYAPYPTQARNDAAIRVTPRHDEEERLTIASLEEACRRLRAAGAPSEAGVQVVDRLFFHSVRASWPA